MVNVVVTGAAGRMGTQIIRLVAAAEDLKLAAAVERPGHAGQGRRGARGAAAARRDGRGRPRQGARGGGRGDRLHEP